MTESMARSLDNIRRDNIQTEEGVTDLQYRSMKMNLVFTGLGGESRNETTECKLREFLENELDIKHFVEFSNVHSFGRYQRRRNRPIIVRFIYEADLDMVLDRVNWLWRTGFGVDRQFPAPMDVRRRALLPVLRQYREEGANVKLVRDRLYVNGKLCHHDSDQDKPPMDSANYSGTSQYGESVHPCRYGFVIDGVPETEERTCGSNSTCSNPDKNSEDCLRILSWNVNRSLVNNLVSLNSYTFCQIMILFVYLNAGCHLTLI